MATFARIKYMVTFPFFSLSRDLLKKTQLTNCNHNEMNNRY